ncbi:MAG: MoaD/ThiS family protein [Desulfotignum sp.]|nr:MoaD/ThiS family protein [Desulfotignum sp.]MCF8112880.1 MoaD/ThiS family protein [Desulfotignum sp.]MCF8125982.1 MoaD/ThiS family protein [Desulfotignum sp.]
MPTITFNAFSFLQKKLKEKKLPYAEVSLSIPEGITANDLIRQMQLTQKDVEVVFVNGRVQPFDTILNHQDRVAFVPHGTPGPYRVLLGFKNKTNG